MKPRISVLSNSNFCTVFTKLMLHNDFEVLDLNLRYSNENMSHDEHFIEQIRELFNEKFYEKELIFTKYDFKFNDTLIERVKNTIKENKPSFIFFEMKTLKPSEWLLLDFINKNYEIPIVAFFPSGEDTEDNILKLYQFGVKEVTTLNNEDWFFNFAKRNKKISE